MPPVCCEGTPRKRTGKASKVRVKQATVISQPPASTDSRGARGVNAQEASSVDVQAPDENNFATQDMTAVVASLTQDAAGEPVRGSFFYSLHCQIRLQVVRISVSV